MNNSHFKIFWKFAFLITVILINTEVSFAITKFSVSKLPLFEKLLCRDQDLSYIEFENLTFENSKIDSIKIIGKNAEEFEIEDYDDIDIPAYQKTRLKIEFKPKNDGKKSAEMIIYSYELEGNYLGRYTVNLFSEKYSFDLSFEKENIDFGEVEIDSIAEKWIYARNTGTTLIEFPKPPIIVGNFEIYEITPRLLQPWQQTNIDAIIKIRFRASNEGNFLEEFKFKDICNKEYSFKVHARVKKYTPPLEPVSFIVENYSANSGEDLSISFKILNHYVLKSQNLTRLISNIKFNNTLLHPIENTPIGEIDGDLRKIKLELDITNDSIFTYKFKAALGNDSITKIEIYETYSPGFINDIRAESGEFKLNDLCYANGARLINVNEIIDLKITLDNLNLAKIEYNLIENASVIIQIYDYYGNLIETLVDNYHHKGYYSSNLNLKKIGSGIYYIILRTPTFNKAYNLNLIR